MSKYVHRTIRLADTDPETYLGTGIDANSNGDIVVISSRGGTNIFGTLGRSFMFQREVSGDYGVVSAPSFNTGSQIILGANVNNLGIDFSQGTNVVAKEDDFVGKCVALTSDQETPLAITPFSRRYTSDGDPAERWTANAYVFVTGEPVANEAWEIGQANGLEPRYYALNNYSVDVSDDARVVAVSSGEINNEPDVVAILTNKDTDPEGRPYINDLTIDKADIDNTLDDNWVFGRNVHLSADGTRLLISAHNAERSFDVDGNYLGATGVDGKVYVFELTLPTTPVETTSYRLLDTLEVPLGKNTPGNTFGIEVSASADLGRIVVAASNGDGPAGESNYGFVTVFDVNPGDPENWDISAVLYPPRSTRQDETPEVVSDGSLYGIDISDDGRVLAFNNGGRLPDREEVYLYLGDDIADGASPTYIITKPTANDNDPDHVRFGSVLKLSGDGTTLFVTARDTTGINGSPNSGTIFVYDIDNDILGNSTFFN